MCIVVHIFIVMANKNQHYIVGYIYYLIILIGLVFILLELRIICFAFVQFS